MLRIYVDEREKNSGIPDLLKQMGILVIFQNLSVGDYIISDDVVIERKSVEDLVSSVFDKRLFDQIERLSEVYPEPILLIEGDLSKIRMITDRWKAINNALISTAIDYNIKVLYSRDREDSAEIIKKVAERIQNRSSKRIISLHHKPKFESLNEVQRYIVESFPNIGSTLANKLLEKFGTIYNICNASITDLEKVIGRKKAEDMYRILRTPYLSNKINKDKKNKSLIDFL
jgi:DNA excision repair protein ERCC-4